MWREKQDNFFLPADHNGSSRKRKSTHLDYSPGATSEYHCPWNSIPIEASLQFESSRQENTYHNNHNHYNYSNREFYQNELKLEKSAYIRPQIDNDYHEYLSESNLGNRFDNEYQHLSNFSPEPRSIGNTSYSLPPQHHPLHEIPAGQPIAVHSQQSLSGYAFDRSESHVSFPSPTPNSPLVGKPQAGYALDRSESHVNFPSPTPNSPPVGKPQVGPNSYDVVNLSNASNPTSLSSLDFARPTEISQQNIVLTNRISEGYETPVHKKEDKLENRGISENEEQGHVVRDTKVVDADTKSQPSLLAKDNSAERQANEKSKSRCGKTVLSVVSEKLWDGSLQLNSSVAVSAVAFFKSGEKMLDTNWCESVEVKGKVRLEAFEKYIQELPRSRTRGLMVISLYWKEGSSDSGLTGMKEVSNGYLKGQKVGFANLSAGVDIYICPRSDKIITILAKYGFFKGLAAIEDNHDSMIGCVVWKRNRPSTKSDSKELEIKKSVSDQNKTLKNETTKINEKKNQEPGESQKNVVNAFTLPGQECLVAQKPKSCLKNQKTVVKEVEKRLTNSDDDDLPEYDFGNVSGFSLVQENKSSEAFIEQTKPMVQTIHAQGINISRNLEQHNISERKTNMHESTKKYLFDDDDMPEWFPQGMNKIPLPESIIPRTAVHLKVPNFPNMSPGPPRAPLHSPLIRVPIPAPSPRQDSFSYQAFSNSPMISPVRTRPSVPLQNSPRYSLGSTPDHVTRSQYNGRRGWGPWDLLKK